MNDPKAIHVDWEPRAALHGMEQLKALEELAYRRVIDLIYVHGNRLIDDNEELARMTKTGSKWKTIKKRLIEVHDKLYVSEDGYLRNKKCDEKLKDIGVRIAKKRKAQGLSVEARKKNAVDNKNKDLPIAEQIAEPVAEPVAECPPGDCLPNNPITQEEREPSGSPKKTNGQGLKKSKRGSRLAADWELPDDWMRWALGERMDLLTIERESMKFKDYWIAKAGQGGVKLDWQATWRNWCRNSADWAKPKQTGGGDMKGAFAKMDHHVIGGLDE